MDLATTIFWVGVGVGALLVGIGVIMIALTLRPVARDVRALATDARRLSRLAESELNNLLGRAHELTEGAEVLSADLAVQLDALKAQTEELEQKVLGEPALGVAPAPPNPGSATSPEPASPPEPSSYPEYAPYPEYSRPQPPAAEPIEVAESIRVEEPMPVGDPPESHDAMPSTDAPGRDAIGSVQSPHAREDEQLA
jgi:hypothetical protein